MTHTPPEQPAEPSYEPTSQGGYQPAAPSGYQAYDAGQAYGTAQSYDAGQAYDAGQSYDAGQAYAAVPAYGAYGAAPVSTERKLSVWGLILGISSIVIPLFINAIAGGILSGIGLAKEPAGRTMAIWGLVTSILGFIWAFLFWPIAITVFFAAIFATQYGY